MAEVIELCKSDEESVTRQTNVRCLRAVAERAIKRERVFSSNFLILFNEDKPKSTRQTKTA